MHRARSSWSACALLVALATSAPATETFELEGGDRITGEVVSETEEVIRVEHPVLGSVEIPRGALARPEQEAPPPNPGLFGTRFLAGWKRSLGLGLSGSEGTAKTVDVSADLSGDFEDEAGRWRARGAYTFSNSARDGGGRKTTRNEAFVNLARDWLLPQTRWFVFAQGRYDYDEFQAWNHRLAGSAGAGYDLLRTETFDLRGRLGAGVSYTWHGEENTSAEAVAGVDGQWRLSRNQRVTASNAIHPDLSDAGEFRTVSSADWVIDVSEDVPASLRLGVLHEYQSNTSERKNDLRYTAALLYEF